MAEIENSQPENYYVNQVEPEAKPPPALETGILKWMRENLFNSAGNTVLTFLGIALVFFTINGLVTWIVRDANWFSVSVNIRNFMLGRYEAEYEWRASLTTYYVFFAMGAAIAIWIRQIARGALITVILIVLSVQVMPRMLNASLELPIWYTGVGNVDIQSNQTTIETIDQIGFIGQEGEEITISLASEANTEEGLANITGFVDVVSNNVRNAAANRLEAIATIEDFEAQIAAQDAITLNDAPVLTTAQYEEYAEEIADAEIADPIVDVYNLNQIPVLVEIIDPDTMEALASVVLTSAEDTLNVTLPRSGWFILNKTLQTEGAELTEGLALLSVQGIFPSSKLESTQSLAYTRRPDGYRLVGVDVPQIDGESIEFIDIIRNQYRGDRPFNDYLRVYVAPFLLNIANFVTLILAIGIAGYLFTEILRNSSGIAVASKFATYALGAIPVVVWILINGMFLNSIMMWLLFVALVMFSYILYKLAQKNGYNVSYLVAGIVAYVVVVGILLITQGFDLPRLLTVLPLLIDDAAVPRFLAWLGIIFVPLAVYLGGQAHIPGDEVEVNIPLLGGVVAVLFAIAAGALLGGFINVDTEWALQPSDPRAWGGLLLTFMLTIYGIIIAFPIGIGLALGRRSDLPLIKYLCTAYIELVRGSPFITVLFFMQLFIPLINSDFNQIPGSYRAIAATIAFSAAYLAENVRGGLQSLPPGQSEAAKALGLNPWQAVTLITMPQALRAVIPALVGQFISLFKDTSLVTIVGLIDLVGFVNAMVVQAEFIGTRLEGLLFISILYFVVSYIMSYVSRLLEASGSGSTRRM